MALIFFYFHIFRLPPIIDLAPKLNLLWIYSSIKNTMAWFNPQMILVLCKNRRAVLIVLCYLKLRSLYNYFHDRHTNTRKNIAKTYTLIYKTCMFTNANLICENRKISQPKMPISLGTTSSFLQNIHKSYNLCAILMQLLVNVKI